MSTVERNTKATPSDLDKNKTTDTIQINVDDFAALQRQLKDLQDRQDRAEQDKADADAKAAGPTSHVEDIEPNKRPEKEQTFIAHTVQVKDENGVDQFKTYRMKSEDFALIAAERGW